MESFDALERAWSAFPPLSRTRGTVSLIVVRGLSDAGPAHTLPARAELTPDAGLAGDRWRLAPNKAVDGQISFIERRIALLLAGGDPARAHLPGDNFHVDLDLSEGALPAGTRLRLGTALVELTPKPHAGCGKFKERFGEDALRWVNEKERRSRRLRGVFAKVLEPGVVSLGDPIFCTP